MSKKDRVKELAAKKARLEQELFSCNKEIDELDWPRVVKVALHGDCCDMREQGEEVGLPEESIDNSFRWALHEVMFELEINKDGTYKILSVADCNQLLIPADPCEQESGT